MYEFTLMIHSWLRWAVLIAAFASIATAFSIRPGTGGDARADRWGLLFMIAMDLQLLIGFLLYFALSPTTAAIFDDFGAAMRDPVARFWAVEHVTLMVVAVVFAHLGRILGRKARTPGAKRTRLLICYCLATAALLAAIPWPGMSAGRPLFRI
ncbi:MAG: hypothetical protein AB7F99_10105 [Vicinamibacterales bacterium]